MRPRPASKDVAPQTLPDGGGETPIRIGISTCLLGEHVRFDGGHKRNDFLVETLGRFVEWVSVCPEVEAGLDTPRESMRLVRKGSEVRLVTGRTGFDHTDRLRRFATKRVSALAKHDLCGYVLKNRSPSCGMERVKIYAGDGAPAGTGRGLFAEELLRAYPNLPTEEEGRLRDPRLRENFIERVFAYRRMRSLFARRWTVGRLVDFHTDHKLQLMAHSVSGYRELGRLVAAAKATERNSLRSTYEERFMSALAANATARRQVNVLQHMLGYFTKQLDAVARREITDLIDDYGNNLVPLVVPLTLIRHYVRRFNVVYLQRQTYLDPHPKELMLRNHV